MDDGALAPVDAPDPHRLVDLDGTVCVVTGGGSGIGRAVVHLLAASKGRVVAADLDEQGATETAGLDRDRIVPERVDVTDPGSVVALRERVLGSLGVPGIVVNAAGWDRIEPFLDTTLALRSKVIAVNFAGLVEVCHAFVGPMVAGGAGGGVVNIASDAGRVGSMGETVYAGAKGGVISFSKSLAREVARHGIRVNCICPGPTDTPLFRQQPERMREALARAIPFRRIATPEEVAAAVLFFASPMAAFVTGQVLSVSGGLTMAG